ncbi:Cytochrome b5 [Macrophomina phaseolina MS6]|uniref:Cytochrome b5 n=1 Tax=Macrophomina phaseolina (strain MS6) TaxID=1126212 RepID=K2RAK9_MACPH|nr:Cytochrome b5 [Macrophomina phaseolina MS6]
MQLSLKLYCQPDDDVAIKAYEEQVDPSFIARINHSHFNYDQFKEVLKQSRSALTFTLSSSDILKWDDAEKKGGVVAQLIRSPSKDKVTGKETKATMLTLSTVKWVNGKRLLTEMTEVSINE